MNNYNLESLSNKSKKREGYSLKDFIFEWNKKDLRDGDTIFVTVYLLQSDNKYIHFRSFHHLYPIFFKDYRFEYKPKSTTLEMIHKSYLGRYPLHNISFNSDTLQIRIKGEAKEDIIANYIFNKGKNNWLYLNSFSQDYALKKKEKIVLSQEYGPTIENFNFYYLN